MKSYQTTLLRAAVSLLGAMLGLCVISGYILAVGLTYQREIQARDGYLLSVTESLDYQLSQMESSLQMNGDSGSWEKRAQELNQATGTYDKMLVLQEIRTKLGVQMANQLQADDLYLRVSSFLISSRHIFQLTPQEQDKLEKAEDLTEAYRRLLISRNDLSSQTLPEGMAAIRFSSFDLIGAKDILGEIENISQELYVFRQGEMLFGPNRKLGEQILTGGMEGTVSFEGDFYTLRSTTERGITLCSPVSFMALQRRLWQPLTVSLLSALLVFFVFSAILKRTIQRMFAPIKDLHHCLSPEHMPFSLQKLRKFLQRRAGQGSIYHRLFRIFMSTMIPLFCMAFLEFLLFYTEVQQQSVSAYLQTMGQTASYQEGELVNLLYLSREIAFSPEIQEDLARNASPEEFEQEMNRYLQRALTEKSVVSVRLLGKDGVTVLYDSLPSSHLSLSKPPSYFEDAAVDWDLFSPDRKQSLTFRICYLQDHVERLPYLSVAGYVQFGLDQVIGRSPHIQSPRFISALLNTGTGETLFSQTATQQMRSLLSESLSLFASEGTSTVLSHGLSRTLLAAFPVENTPFQILYAVELDNALLNPFSFLYMIFLLAAVLLTTFLANFFHQKLLQPLLSLESAVSCGNPASQALRPCHGEIYELGQAFTTLLEKTEELQENIHQKELSLLRMEKKQQETEKIALQQQVDPHFLCNILLSIDMMIRNGQTEQAETTTRMLGKYLRGLLGSSFDTTIEEEFQRIETYLEIQNIRFGQNLSYHFQQDGDGVKKIKIPRFLIQPLVENSLIHGAPGNRPLDIYISVRRRENTVCITVCDNGRGMDAEKLREIQGYLCEEGTHIGLRNVRDRIQLRWAESGLELQSTPEHGTKAVVWFRL